MLFATFWQLHFSDCVLELPVYPGAFLCLTSSRGIGPKSVPFSTGCIKRADVYVPIFMNYSDQPKSLSISHFTVSSPLNQLFIF